MLAEIYLFIFIYFLIFILYVHWNLFIFMGLYSKEMMLDNLLFMIVLVKNVFFTFYFVAFVYFNQNNKQSSLFLKGGEF
ncbi:hypothetical protein HanIR_Chr04g0166801 [Helianthus annuus]|nr:hypothetical protein HanIR_Chr04g0166801 [Helianthus annuus]